MITLEVKGFAEADTLISAIYVADPIAVWGQNTASGRRSTVDVILILPEESREPLPDQIE